jgi:acetyltransferase-like isoleucine patch superfamily enzyme
VKGVLVVPLATKVREWVREIVLVVRRQYYVSVWKMTIGEGTSISLSAKLDKTNPRGVHIGRYTAISFGAAVLTHDWVNDRHLDVHIGDNCFIGAHAIVLPGVTIGDHCIVSAASVVVRDLPAGSFVAGNPARVLEKDVLTDKWGIRRQKTG